MRVSPVRPLLVPVCTWASGPRAAAGGAWAVAAPPAQPTPRSRPMPRLVRPPCELRSLLLRRVPDAEVAGSDDSYPLKRRLCTTGRLLLVQNEAQDDRTLRDRPPARGRRQRRGLPRQRHAAAAPGRAQDPAHRTDVRRAVAHHHSPRSPPRLRHRAPQRLRHLRGRRERRRRLHRHAVRAGPVARSTHRRRARPASSWFSRSASRWPTACRPRTRWASFIAT